MLLEQTSCAFVELFAVETGVNAKLLVASDVQAETRNNLIRCVMTFADFLSRRLGDQIS